MPAQEAIIEQVEYRLVLVLPHSGKLLALSDTNGYHLPVVNIQRWTRPAEELQKAILAKWKLHVLILDFFRAFSLFVIAEVLVLTESSDLKAVPLQDFEFSVSSADLAEWLDAFFAGESQSRFSVSRLGWIDEAITWLESETGRKLPSKRAIDQYNGGGGFMLIRFRIEDHLEYWLKATSAPNTHEFSITRLLARLCGDYLPEVLSFKPAWNAWLMSGKAAGVVEMPEEPSALCAMLGHAVQSMANLQIQALGHTQDLLCAGAVDQSIGTFQTHAEELFAWLEEAMSFQTSTRAPRLEKKRIQELRTVFERICQRMQSLDIGDTIVHGDLNPTNILTESGHCRFVDWSEAFVGNPLISLEHLLLLNKSENPAVRATINSILRERYLSVWADCYHFGALQAALLYIPLLAIGSTLYGRGAWLGSSERRDPWRQSYARSLTRQMDRAAREPNLLEALCI